MADTTVSGISAVNNNIAVTKIEAPKPEPEKEAVNQVPELEPDAFVPSTEEETPVVKEEETQSPSDLVQKVEEEKTKEKEEAKEKIEKEKQEEKEVEKQVRNENSALAKQSPKVKLVKINGQWIAKKPETEAIKAHDSHMREVERKYVDKNPEPAFSDDGSDTGSESVEHAKWIADKKKHLKKEDTDYRAEHKDYARDIEAYNRAKRKAQSLNKVK